MKSFPKFICILCLTLMFVITNALNSESKAQTPVILEGDPGFGGGGAEGGGGDGGPAVPFDGGMSMLILSAGAGYFARKLKEQQSMLYPSA